MNMKIDFKKVDIPHFDAFYVAADFSLGRK